jgi:Ca2+-binding EF-hand superfamily protein
MAKIDQQSSKIDIEICFNVFDKENRGYITFGDFKQVVANEIGSKSQPARKMKSVPPPQPMRAPSVGRQIEI